MDVEQSLRHVSEPSFRARSKRRSPLPLLHWLLVAVGLCWLSWPAPAEAQAACTHDICEVGGKLNPVCDQCVDDICNDPQNPENDYCCTVEWDNWCIDRVLELCLDPSCAQVCDHNPCEVGGALDSTCSECTAEVCFLDPSCCTDDGDPLTDDWDASCVNKVQQGCGVQCEPGANLCSEAIPIRLGTIYGTLLGSTNDGKESGNNSNRSGDVWYEYTQGAADDMVLSTCTTQRSYAIDTVLSVHEGATVLDRCPGNKVNEILENDDSFSAIPRTSIPRSHSGGLTRSLPARPW